jgi:glutamate racemase
VTRPVGVFDSGIGGLSVLQSLRAELPHQPIVYLADSGHAPYGEREPGHVIERSQAIVRHLIETHDIQALVVACNTATAAAIDLLRVQHPELPIVGVEPALKPAVQLSQTRRVGVLATRSTLQSTKFRALRDSLPSQVDFMLQACDGLADAIEHQDNARIESLARLYTQALGACGLETGQIDTVVLGCTHYPLVAEKLQSLLGPDVELVASGAPVARQTRRVLQQVVDTGQPTLRWLTTGPADQLQIAVQRWLQPQARVETLKI